MSARAKPLLFMVDDEPSFLKLVAHWLESDYELRTFTSADGVLEAMGETAPDLVILDAYMHPVDGYELCRRIRDDSRFDLISVLFLTGARSDTDLVKQIEAGGSGFLTKPIERTELLRVIAEELVA